VAIDSNGPRGFSGLESLVSEVAVETPRKPSPKETSEPLIEGRPAGTAPLPGTSPERPPEASNNNTAWFIGLGLLALVGVIVAIIQATTPKASTVNTVSTTTQTYQPEPTKPPQVIERTNYILKGSDGSRMELEAPADATAAQLNALAQSKWRPKEVIPTEDIPPVGQGLLFEDDQIRYCLSQKIRLGGWQITVDSYDHSSVVAFNAKVDDYNARCSHFKYRDGALERIRAQVESRHAILDVDGRLHRGPRPPEKPPTFKVASSRKQTVVNGKLHERCAGSTEIARCEALESQLDKETPVQKRARQQRLDAERDKAMATANGG